MPGTIQVTVLEFKGFSSPSKPSAKSLKVSMGKRQYQTWDKGEFSFPITKLGENLVVALLDAGGNEIAHKDIGAMQIIQKGCWDDVFTINGGGHVHLKLQFFLSQQDRTRIRLMRESAIRKKLETNPNMNLRLLEEKVSDVVSLKVEALRAGSSVSSTTSSTHPNNHGRQILETNATGGIPVQDSVAYETIQTQTVANVRSDKLQNIRAVENKNNSVASKLQDIRPIEHKKTSVASMNQDGMERSPSNVRKMISAFEIPQLQEMKSMKKSSSVPAQLNRLKKGGALLEDHDSKADKTTFKDFKDQLPNKPTLKASDDSMRQSSSETATSSGRIPHDAVSSAAEESGSGRGTSLKSMASNCKDESYLGRKSGMWIFPDNPTHFCLTSAGNQANHNISSQSKNVMHEIEFENGNGEVAESESCNSPDNSSSNGLVAQVVKIGVVIGFTVLVFLTRQKEPRKKEREENGNLFHVPEYVDTTLKPWTVKR